jgi:2-aminoadipate transaminase
MMSNLWTDHFAERTSRMKVSAIRELLSVAARPEIISFAGGLPATDLLPLEEVAVATENLLRKYRHSALQYGPTEGHEPLREQIAEMYRARGVPASVDNILLLSGSQQGLDFVGRIFIDDGDTLLVEAPTYVGALQAWSPFAPQFLTLPTDADGMLVDLIDTLDAFKLVYLLPNFQNPSGITLSADRREIAVEAIHRRRALIVEDDPYRELRYSGHDIPSLIEIEAQHLGTNWNAQGRIIHLGTFSKTLAPGLRVGWVVAPSPVIRQMVLAKQGADLHTSTLNQMIVSELVADNTIQRNVPRLQEVYRERRDAMLDCLTQYLGSQGTWTRPDGGLFLWLKLNNALDTQALLNRAVAEKQVAYVPGAAFYVDGSGINELRLNFSATPPERIRDGVSRLASLITEPVVSV